MSRRGSRRGGKIALLGLLAVVAGALWLASALYIPYQGFPREGVFVEIPRGTSRRAIARLLADAGVVRSRIAFEALCRWRHHATLQAGEYFFDRPVTATEVFETIAQGRVYFHVVTVPEGLTMYEIADLMEREGFCSRQEFLQAAGDPTPIRDLAPEARTLEGFLFPATYQFPHRVTTLEIAGAMVRRFREVWNAFPEGGRNPYGLSPAEVVTIASLVERETAVPEERPIIAGIFYHRLRLGVALQCDPTVIYGLRLANRFTGGLSAADLRWKSPYNTYLHPGLPPGPIANPGSVSLRAALYPPPVDYLYFVSNTQGGHFFSRTLAEHLRNVARYKRLLARNAGPNSEVSNGARPGHTAKPKRPR